MKQAQQLLRTQASSIPAFISPRSSKPLVATPLQLNTARGEPNPHEPAPPPLPAPASPPYPFTDPFADPAKALKDKSTSELLRAWGVFKACQVKPLVDSAEFLLASPLLRPLAARTFFPHFCAGETLADVRRTARALGAANIGAIIQYGAERSVGEAACTGSEAELAEAERCWDENLANFTRDIAEADTEQRTGCLAFKMTALGSPALLEKVSGLLEARQPPSERGTFSAALEADLAPDLTPLERCQLAALLGRLDRLGAAVEAKGNMRALVDAEWARLQPAIDALAVRMQQRHNTAAAHILNTFQLYLKDSRGRLEADMCRSRREGWAHGAKLVRGAYMVAERARAAELGRPSPIHDSLEATHANYDGTVAAALGHAARHPENEVLVGSHNQASVQAACRRMAELGLPPSHPGVYFAQLLGMSDVISYSLARERYRVYKICTYGPLQETMAFLVRRAQENAAVLGGTGRELGPIRAELLRRAGGRAAGGLGWGGSSRGAAGAAEPLARPA